MDAEAVEPEDAEPVATPVPERSRWARFGVIGAIIGIGAALVVPNVPRSQEVRLHLGPGSSRVVRMSARVGSGHAEGGWDRQTTWRFDRGAPPSVSWSFQLPHGEADVEVELSSALAATASKRIHLELSGKETVVELAEAMRGLE